MRCDFRHSHNLTTDKPMGEQCDKEATHRISWEDGRFSFGCDDHLDIEPQSSVKPTATAKLVVINGWTQADLDKFTCYDEGCTKKHHHGPVFIHARCHPKNPVIAKYHYLGHLEIRCKTCNKFIVNVFVAPEEQETRGRQMIENCPHGDNCNEPPENHIALVRGCADHRGAGVHIAYWKGDVTIACARCKGQIDTLHVKHQAGQA